MKKLSKETWEKIQNFLCKNAEEIWQLATSNTTSTADAVVWLDLKNEEDFYSPSFEKNLVRPEPIEGRQGEGSKK